MLISPNFGCQFYKTSTTIHFTLGFLSTARDRRVFMKYLPKLYWKFSYCDYSFHWVARHHLFTVSEKRFTRDMKQTLYCLFSLKSLAKRERQRIQDCVSHSEVYLLLDQKKTLTGHEAGWKVEVGMVVPTLFHGVNLRNKRGRKEDRRKWEGKGGYTGERKGQIGERRRGKSMGGEGGEWKTGKGRREKAREAKRGKEDEGRTEANGIQFISVAETRCRVALWVILTILVY